MKVVELVYTDLHRQSLEQFPHTDYNDQPADRAKSKLIHMEIGTSDPVVAPSSNGFGLQRVADGHRQLLVFEPCRV